MAPLVAPLCTVHREPTKELTVNKPGLNKGKKFYVCSRFAVLFAAEGFCNVNESFFGAGLSVQGTIEARPRGSGKK